jgi:type VI secretion system protein ImpJ
MTRYRKVVWYEGMLLSSHHFQQWDNYHEELLHSRLASAVPYGWGVLDLHVDRDALTTAQFRLRRCRGLLPDGLWIDVPATDAAPPERDVRPLLVRGAEQLDVYLGVPAQRSGHAQFQGDDGEPDATLRFWRESRDVPDETDGGEAHPVSFAHSNLRLLVGDEPRDGYSSIKIAEVTLTTTGQLSLSDTYVPPALAVSSSQWLVGTLEQLISLLSAKGRSLGDRRRRETRAGSAAFNMSEVKFFWLLHTINSALPRLTHLDRTFPVHPERLYDELSRLAGELMTFDTNRQLKDIPPYDHDDLRGIFERLSTAIREMLETSVPTRCVTIPLNREREWLYVGHTPGEVLQPPADFYLAVHSTLPVPELIETVPRSICIASRDDIEDFISEALPGVPLKYVETPDDITTRAGFHCFELDRSSQPWENIRDSKGLALWVPSEISDAMIELYALKPL